VGTPRTPSDGERPRLRRQRVLWHVCPMSGHFLSHLVVGFDGESLVVEDADDFNSDCGAPYLFASASRMTWVTTYDNHREVSFTCWIRHSIQHKKK
jgi:hypothetical protein